MEKVDDENQFQFDKEMDKIDEKTEPDFN